MGAKLAGWNYEIIGTDLSMKILEKAQSALYSQFEVQRGLPVEMMLKYFEQDGANWRFKQEYREKVKFRKANLLEDQRILGQFDVVFCRNVLIYFDRDTKSEVLDMIADMMPEDGKLFLGGAETVLGLTDRFVAVEGVKGLYKKPAAS
jgi:chemotaxis protein methyltransferase CheR